MGISLEYYIFNVIELILEQLNCKKRRKKNPFPSTNNLRSFKKSENHFSKPKI